MTSKKTTKIRDRFIFLAAVLLDTDGSVIKKYPVIGLPTTFVIDPRGIVTHRAVGGREWDNEQLLGQLRKLLHRP